MRLLMLAQWCLLRFGRGNSANIIENQLGHCDILIPAKARRALFI